MYALTIWCVNILLLNISLSIPPHLGVKNLALLNMFPEGESLSENVTPSLDYSTDSNMHSHTSKEGKDSSKAAPATFTHVNVNIIFKVSFKSLSVGIQLLATFGPG